MNKKPLEVVNRACQSMVLPFWSAKSDWCRFSLNGIGYQTRVKFVIGHWSVSIHLSIVSQIGVLELRLSVSFTA